MEQVVSVFITRATFVNFKQQGRHKYAADPILSCAALAILGTVWCWFLRSLNHPSSAHFVFPPASWTLPFVQTAQSPAAASSSGCYHLWQWVTTACDKRASWVSVEREIPDRSTLPKTWFLISVWMWEFWKTGASPSILGCISRSLARRQAHDYCHLLGPC